MHWCPRKRCHPTASADVGLPCKHFQKCPLLGQVFWVVCLKGARKCCSLFGGWYVFLWCVNGRVASTQHPKNFWGQWPPTIFFLSSKVCGPGTIDDSKLSEKRIRRREITTTCWFKWFGIAPYYMLVSKTVRALGTLAMKSFRTNISATHREPIGMTLI